MHGNRMIHSVACLCNTIKKTTVKSLKSCNDFSEELLTVVFLMVNENIKFL